MSHKGNLPYEWDESNKNQLHELNLPGLKISQASPIWTEFSFVWIQCKEYQDNFFSKIILPEIERDAHEGCEYFIYMSSFLQIS